MDSVICFGMLVALVCISSVTMVAEIYSMLRMITAPDVMEPRLAILRSTAYYEHVDQRIRSLTVQVEQLQKKSVALHAERDRSNMRTLESLHKIRKAQVDLNDGLFHVLEQRFDENAGNGISGKILPQTLDDLSDNFLLTKYAAKLLRSVHERSRTSILRSESDKVQKRLFELQYPRNCRKRKKLLCILNKKCGLGCQLHHVLMCLIAGVALNRTMILITTPWNYSPNGWEAVFLPVTNCTEKIHDINMIPVMNVSDTLTRTRHKVLLYPFFPYPDPQWLPFALPDDLPEMVGVVHENPSLWWISQGLWYLWRLQPNITELIRQRKGYVDFSAPVVGIHIRRTDKLNSEAKAFPIADYVRHAETYWLENNFTSADQKRIYLASDDPSVVRKFQKSYGEKYTIYANVPEGRMKRYSETSLIYLLYDIHFLSKCHYFVCTFSSLICKMAYELKQASEDAYGSFYSLDHRYWLPGSSGRNYVASRDHLTDEKDGLNFTKGDVLFDLHYHMNGLATGTTRRNGTFPWYKVEEIFRKGNYTLF